MNFPFKDPLIQLIDNVKVSNKKIPCERCGAEDAKTYTAASTETTIDYQRLFGNFFYKEPLYLCFACTIAQESFLQALIMLSVEQTTKTGRYQAIEEGKNIWGDDTMDMLALLQVAKTSMDSARRLLTEQEFNKIKPWLVESIKRDSES